QIFTLPLYYRSWLHGDPANVVRLAGGLLLCAAVAVLFVKLRAARPLNEAPPRELAALVK
ncbi:MAG TPA: hypothetical protein VGF27_06055, partial [Pseudoduganella sp.]